MEGHYEPPIIDNSKSTSSGFTQTDSFVIRDAESQEILKSARNEMESENKKIENWKNQNKNLNEKDEEYFPGDLKLPEDLDRKKIQEGIESTFTSANKNVGKKEGQPLLTEYHFSQNKCKSNKENDGSIAMATGKRYLGNQEDRSGIFTFQLPKEESLTELETARRKEYVLYCLKKSIAEIEEQCKKYRIISGATLVCSLRIGDDLYILNIGDSRAVLVDGKNIVRLTCAHKPDSEREKGKFGPEVANYYSNSNYDDAVARVDKYLAVTRSIGDYRGRMKANTEVGIDLISSKPDILKLKLKKGLKAKLILVSDGISDLVSDQELGEILEQKQESPLADQALAIATAPENHLIAKLNDKYKNSKTQSFNDTLKMSTIGKRMDNGSVVIREMSDDISPNEVRFDLVTDGHAGKEVANYIMQHLPNAFYANIHKKDYPEGYPYPAVPKPLPREKINDTDWFTIKPEIDNTEWFRIEDDSTLRLQLEQQLKRQQLQQKRRLQHQQQLEKQLPQQLQEQQKLHYKLREKLKNSFDKYTPDIILNALNKSNQPSLPPKDESPSVQLSKLKMETRNILAQCKHVLLTNDRRFKDVDARYHELDQIQKNLDRPALRELRAYADQLIYEYELRVLNSKTNKMALYKGMAIHTILNKCLGYNDDQKILDVLKEFGEGNKIKNDLRCRDPITNAKITFNFSEHRNLRGLRNLLGKVGLFQKTTNTEQLFATAIKTLELTVREQEQKAEKEAEKQNAQNDLKQEQAL